MELMVFSKHLTGMPLTDAARRLKERGIAALDLTVRPGGHVLPERAVDDLPRVHADLAALGVRIGMITTNITATDSSHAEAILRSAARLGIGYYKLGYYGYKGHGTLRKARDEVRARLRDLAAMNRAIGIRGGFHNHSGGNVGASLWDVDYVLGDLPNTQMGVYLDPAHATIEGGLDGWRLGLDLIAPRVIMMAVKDFRWSEPPNAAPDAKRDKVRFRPRFCPLEQGNVAWDTIFSTLKQTGFDGPVSLHIEYEAKNSPPAETIEITARDGTLLRRWLTAAGWSLST
jgi:L-ribulose-5-phosphate 3-epimerase